MQITNISEVKTNLSSLIKWVQKNNKSIIIGESGKPVAILSPYLENITPRKLGGSWENKVKIAHIQVLPIMSGVQKAMCDVLIRLDKEKYDILVICQSKGELTDFLEKNKIKFHVLNELRRKINPYFDFIAFIKLYIIFRQEKYDLIHTHSSKPGIIGRVAAKFAGIKCIVHTVQGFAFRSAF